MGMAEESPIEWLEQLRGEIPSLFQGEVQKLMAWHRNGRLAIEKIFNSNKHTQEWTNITFIGPGPISMGLEKYHNEASLGKADALLASMIDEIKRYGVEVPKSPDNLPVERSENPPALEVFIIHGHDEGLKETVARFIQNQGFKPIILHEQPNEGKTIIEKLEKHSSVGFAIALLSPDDVGGKKEHLQPRARQNVIFEMGYFSGKLGRHRVCALKKTGVETPSDYDGVVYIPFDDAGTWKLSLVKELRAAGFPADANKIT